MASRHCSPERHLETNPRASMKSLVLLKLTKLPHVLMLVLGCLLVAPMESILVHQPAAVGPVRSKDQSIVGALSCILDMGTSRLLSQADIDGNQVLSMQEAKDWLVSFLRIQNVTLTPHEYEAYEKEFVDVWQLVAGADGDASAAELDIALALLKVLKTPSAVQLSAPTQLISAHARKMHFHHDALLGISHMMKVLRTEGVFQVADADGDESLTKKEAYRVIAPLLKYSLDISPRQQVFGKKFDELWDLLSSANGTVTQHELAKSLRRLENYSYDSGSDSKDPHDRAVQT